MKYLVTSFDSHLDKKKVISGLAISIDDCLRTGVVPDSSSDLESNEIEDPEFIVGRIRDTFDAIDLQRGLKATLKRAKDMERKSSKTSKASSSSSSDSSDNSSTVENG